MSSYTALKWCCCWHQTRKLPLLMTPRTAVWRMLSIMCTKGTTASHCLNHSNASVHHWHPTMPSALIEPWSCLLSSLPTSVSAWGRVGEQSAWQTELVSESVWECHISLPWNISPVFQTYPKPETEWSSSILFISQFWKEHCEMILWL